MLLERHKKSFFSLLRLASVKLKSDFLTTLIQSPSNVIQGSKKYQDSTRDGDFNKEAGCQENKEGCACASAKYRRWCLSP
jgi:hypothetical protein